jgi:hypothetical protein
VLVALGAFQLLRGGSDPAGQAGTETSATRSSARATPGTPSGTSSGTPSGTASSSATPAGDRIELAWRSDFARPFETVRVAGEYHGAAEGTTLRVQLRRGDRWTPFPLPVVTQASGRFRAFVELGEPGVYRLRVLDPEAKIVSDTLTLTIF